MDDNRQNLLERTMENIDSRNCGGSGAEWQNALKHGSRTFLKTFGALALSLGIAVGVSGCSFTLNNTTNTDSGDTSSETENGTENGTETGSETGSDTPSTTSTKYSAFLNRILNDPDIKAMIDRVDNDNSIEYLPTEMYPNPWTFLASQGHDVDRIKSGELECHTTSYIPDSEPNNLYMMTYVETPGGSVPYYTEYCIRYTLTDQELKDYNLLHGSSGRVYMQAEFANDAISATHKATIVSKTKINMEAHKNILAKVKSSPTITQKLGGSDMHIILKNPDVENQTLQIYILAAGSSNYKFYNSSRYVGEMEFSVPSNNLAIENDVCTYSAPNGSCISNGFIVKPYNVTVYQSESFGYTLHNWYSVID